MWISECGRLENIAGRMKQRTKIRVYKITLRVQFGMHCNHSKGKILLPQRDEKDQQFPVARRQISA
jgi:hypothetical protein